MEITRPTVEINYKHKEQTYDKKAIFTAYNLEVSQTDGEPCIGSGNHNLCEEQKKNPNKCIVATKLYPLHTKIKVKDYGICEVLDRTSKKYGSRIDILMDSKKNATKFGLKELEYYIVK